MSFRVLDCKRVGHYSLPAGHIASRLSQTGKTKSICKILILCVGNSFAPFFSTVGRKGDTFGCAGSFVSSLRTPFRSATIILMFWQNSNKKELALHIHYFLALDAKSYNDTT